ncbi:putative pectate lyase 7 [Morus notabilis]|uniref:Pectate lyase n=1 Tax=Morus notabilis TaxID=981085 RepID=W9R1D9_9ROSA|nr:putative pectate lyase 7 [Morus notabilis]
MAHSHIAEFDDYWKSRAEEARKDALQAYSPHPHEVTDQLNYDVQEALTAKNNTRRQLRGRKNKKGGPCMATNPIDRCWRCDPNWANNRKRLADCTLGFGRNTVGGKFGPYYIVTDPSDTDLINPKPGTLRHAVIQKKPLWIIFARSMIIRLSEELIMTGDKTIDARGANVRIAYGAGITIQFVKNVIIHNLHIHDIVASGGGNIRDSADHVGFRTKSDGDGISIFGSSNVWIDHVSMSNCQDGLIDAIMGSTAITISNCHFTHHNESGFNSMHTSKFRGQIWGFFHVVNNDYTHWLMYAIGGSQHPTIISQGNRFIAPPNDAAKQVTKRDYAPESEWKNWQWRSEGDLLMNGAFFVQSGKRLSKRRFSRLDMIKYKPGTFVTRLTRYAGTLLCGVGRPC